MKQFQRMMLTERVAKILDEPAPHSDSLYAAQVLYGATKDELVEIVANLDAVAANGYQAYRVSV